MQKNQRSNFQYSLNHRESKGIQGKKTNKQTNKQHIYFSFIDHAKTFNCMDHNKLENS